MSLHPRMKVWLSDRLRAARSILEAPDSTPSQRSVARAELGIWGEETKSRAAEREEAISRLGVDGDDLVRFRT